MCRWFYSDGMVALETAEMVARSRMISAQALFEGRADLNGYPFRLLGVYSMRAPGLDNVSMVLAAAETLMQYGWELVNISKFTEMSSACAIMRRPAGQEPYT
jgi:hypothetical protein